MLAPGAIGPDRDRNAEAGRQARPLSFRAGRALRRAWLTGLALALATACLPSIAAADGVGRGRLFVPGDTFDPGDAFSILGTDLDPGADLVLVLASGSTRAEVGRATVGDDRSITSTAIVPAGFPTGYAELTATASGGTSWSTYILIGERPEGPRPAASASIDDRALGFIALAFGVVMLALAAALLLRGRTSGRR